MNTDKYRFVITAASPNSNQRNFHVSTITRRSARRQLGIREREIDRAIARVVSKEGIVNKPRR